jgi:glycosyltransferase involved in cell wall biosynthesis
MQISVIVPVRNEKNSIRELLDGLLQQTRRPDEIVITDGGSTDDTVAIIEDYIKRGAPIQLVQSGPALPGRGRNLAASRASFEWLAFIDAGVTPDPGWLEHLVSTVQRDKRVDVVYGSYEPRINSFFEECAAIAYVQPPVPTAETYMRTNSIASALMKREVWREAGEFPEHLRSAEDLLFMKRVAALKRQTAFSPNAVVHWSLQPTLLRTFKKFVAYARSNIQAGLWKQWQAAIFQRYALLLLTALPALFFGWWWLIITGLLFVLLLAARAIVAIRRNRRSYPASFGHNLLRLVLLIPFIAVLDVAAIVGSIQWLVHDKLRLGNATAGVADGA